MGRIPLLSWPGISELSSVVGRGIMQPTQQRRSCRIAASIPVRVYAVDYRAKDFVEDTTTLVVNQHGAKIRLIRQLIPDQEIRLLSLPTRLEAVFRVVARAPGTEGACTSWGIESMSPERNIWGVRFPDLQQRDQEAVRVMLQCPHCLVRELVYVDEPVVESLDHVEGLTRGCLTCKKSGVWKPVPYVEF